LGSRSYKLEISESRPLPPSLAAPDGMRYSIMVAEPQVAPEEVLPARERPDRFSPPERRAR